MKGCGRYIKNKLKWDGDEGWICGQYYDAIKDVIHCDECANKIAKGKEKKE